MLFKAGGLTLESDGKGIRRLHQDGSPGAHATVEGYNMPYKVTLVMFDPNIRRQPLIFRRLCSICKQDMIKGIACAREDCTSEPLKGVKTVLDLKLKLREVNASSLEEWYVNGSDASILEAVLISEQAAMLIERWILSLGSIAARRGA